MRLRPTENMLPSFSRLLRWLVFAIAILIVVVTIVPISSTNAWWVRGWSFPRLQILVVALLTLVALAFFRKSSFARSLIGATLLCAVYQASWIYPYTPLVAPEIADSNSREEDAVSLLSFNVRMANTQFDATSKLIENTDPDVVFLMETNQKWVDGLAQITSKFASVTSIPLENHYGLIFATNLPVDSIETIYLSDHQSPTVLAKLRDPSGRRFGIVALHPPPPVPGQSSEDRDQQISNAARLSEDWDIPVISMGDFNVPAWSKDAQRFKSIGGFYDPRVGRGILSSFDAQSYIMRFPIDQLYMSEEFDLLVFDRLEPSGSDHFPLFSKIAISGD